MLKYLIDETTFCAGYADLETLLTKMCGAIGTRYASYIGCGLTTTDFSQRFLSNLPKEWIDYTRQQDLDQCDPVYFKTKKQLLPYFWDNDPEASSPEVKDFLDVAWDFGTRSSGLAIPVRGPSGDKGLLCVIPERGGKDWRRYCGKHLAELILFAQSFHAALVKVEAANCRADVELTPRECQVLSWAAQGKTAWETGQILGLTEGTVKFYTRNACKKLGVRSKAHAIARCVAIHRISV